MKKTVSFVLIIAMLMGCTAVAFAGSQPECLTYLSLGDSTWIGYGLPSYTDPERCSGTVAAYDCAGFDCLVEGSAAYLVDQHLRTKYENVKTLQYGLEATRPYDYRVLLDPSFPMDEDFIWCFTDGANSVLRYALMNTEESAYALEWDADQLRNYFVSRYTEGVKQADVISLHVWSNDFMGWLSPFFIGDVHPNLRQFITNLKYDGSSEAIRSLITEKLGDLLPEKKFSLLPNEIQEFVDICACGYMDATIGMDQLICCIKDLNPNAQIVLCGAQSLTGDTVIRMDGVDIPYGAIMDVLAKLVDNYRKNLSPYRNLYSFADLNKYHCETYMERMQRPAETYDEEVKQVATIILGCMPETADPSAADGGADAAFARFREAICHSNVAVYGTQDPDTWEYAQSPAAAAYILHGPEGLTESELKEAYDYWATAVRMYAYVGSHPSLAGCKATAQAVIDALSLGKTAKQAAADDAWEGLKKWTESMHEKRMDWEDKTFDFRMDVAEGLLKTTVVNLTLGKIIKNIITLPLKARCR